MSFASVYPHYVAKAERKGRTRDEVDAIIRWLTGYSQMELEARIAARVDFRAFFADAPTMNPARPNQRRRLRHPRRKYRRAADARDSLSRQADRRTRKGQGDGEDPARARTRRTLSHPPKGDAHV
ncbi:DUF2200 family protein [Sphingopyxis solisilvae]